MIRKYCNRRNIQSTDRDLLEFLKRIALHLQTFYKKLRDNVASSDDPEDLHTVDQNYVSVNSSTLLVINALI